jgi:hypothetical protein
MRKSPIARQILLAFVVAIGIGAAWCFVSMWLVATVEQTRLTQQSTPTLAMRYDGQVVTMHYQDGYAAGQQLFTLDGERATGSSQQVSHPGYLNPPPHGMRGDIQSHRLAGASDGGSPAVYWYLFHDGRVNGQAYGIGYDSLSKRVVGHFGRSGFTAEKPPREDWFQIAGDQGLGLVTPSIASQEPYGFLPLLHLLANGQLWTIDVRKKQVQAVQAFPDAFTVGWSWRMLAELPVETDDPTHRATEFPLRKLTVRTLDRLTLFDPRDGESVSFPIPTALQDKMLGCFEQADGSFVLMAMVRQGNHIQHDIAWLDREGNVQRERTVRFEYGDVFNVNPALGAVVIAVTSPTPMIMTMLTFIVATDRSSSGEYEAYGPAMTATLADFWPAMLLTALVSLALAILAYRRQRRYSLSHPLPWAIFVFLLGVPGYLAYRFHRTWPVLEDCPRCGEATPRDRERCSDCGAAFPPPELKGLEIFA